MASFTEKLKAKGVSNGALSFTQKLDKRIAEDKAEEKRRSKTLVNLSQTNPNDPINKLAPLERDRAEQARRSKMGTTKNMTSETITSVAPPKPTLLQKVGNFAKGVITDPLGTLDRIDQSQFGKDIMAGVGQANKSTANVLKSIGGDKVPIVKDALSGIDKMSDPLIQQGGTGILSQVTQSLPRAASNMGLAFLSGGASVPAQLGGNATLQAAKQVLTSPTFANSMLQSYGGAYGQAREEGANRPQAITKGLLQAFPQALIEQAGGVEQLPANVAKQSLLKTIGKSALEEGIEEVFQYPFEALARKATYAPNTPFFSMNENAVINPKDMAQGAIVGGLAGGLLGGGAKAVTGDISLPKFKRDVQQTQQQTAQQAPIQAQQQAAPTTEQVQQPRQESEILQKRRQAELLRKEYEQIKATSKLTPDELTIADNIRKGKLSAVPQGFNTQIINEVANAGRLYDQADGEVKAFNETRKQMLRDTMGNLLEASDNAKDKSGAFLSREIQERNSIDVFGEETGKKVNETIFRPVHDNEAKKTRFINKYVDRVKNMNLSKAESEAVQMLGEGKIAEHELPANMEKGKIKNAVAEFRKTYDGLLSLANDVLVKNGYAPVEYRKDYFPHFEDPKDPFVKAMKNLGFKVDNITLPTDIAGITHQFRPGKKWFGNFLRREGTNTTYDALEGFERYLYGISDVIYHTNDIQRLRAFETAIRSKYAPDNIKNRITEIEQSGLSADDQQAAIDALFEIDKGHLGSYVTDLRAYTDNLAGKKSISDRNMEHKMGRAAYNIFDNMNTQVARNMVGFNVSSWLTNFIPLAQAGAGIKTKNFIKAANETVLNYYKDDGFVNKSTFLTNRKGTERLTRTTVQKIADAGMAPMQMIDEFTSQILVRGKYLEGIENGLSHKEAMQKADSYVAGAMADRSKGSMPTAFNTKNPLTKLFTMFQLEVNNQFSFLFKDIPREAKEKGGKWLASTLLKFMVGSFLYNELYEKLTGRRPTIDPIGTVKRAVEKGTPLEALQSVGEDVLEQTPFVGGIAGGGRLPIGAALPDLMSVVKGDSKLGKEMLKPLTYLVSPIGGGGQAKKAIEGLKAFGQGASLSDTGRMRYPIPKTLPNALRTGLFGQYSTPEAREYFDKNRSTLSPNQTQQVMSSEDPQQAYLRIMQERQINSLNQKIKDVAADDTLTRAEKDKKITELRQKIIELRN